MPWYKNNVLCVIWMLLLSTKLCVVCLRSDASRLFHCNSCRGQMIIRTFESKLSDDDNRAPTETMDDTILFSSDWEEDRETKEEEDSSREPGRGWFKLPPKVRLALIQKGQERAIANKKKREPADVKKRRVMMFFKQAQIDKKMRSKIKRPLPIRSAARIPLEQLISDKNRPLNGTVISLTTFGAYIDVLSGCDGLLHVSQMSTNGTFIENIRDVLQPGDILENCLYVHRCSPELNKLQLTMVPPRSIEQEEEEEEEEGQQQQITLEELQVDDELWGEIKRVTNFGAFVELGAVVPGFLHFMDHPDYDQFEHPSEYMMPKQRVRVWVNKLDMDRKRIQLTANRPNSLPQIRRRDNIPSSLAR